MKLFLSAAIAALAIAGSAAAAEQTFTFNGTTSAGAYTATGSLDVVNGFAISGSGEISGTGIPSESLFLVTPGSAGVEPFTGPGGGYLLGANDGTNIQFDTSVPIDTNGLAFTLGSASTGRDAEPILNIYSDGGSPTGFTTFFAGRIGDSTYYGGGATSVQIAPSAVSAAPEPGTWALMLGGIGIVGAMMRVAKARRREDELKSIATA